MAVLKGWIEAACWAVLRWLDASCPTCNTPVATSFDGVRRCEICNKPILAGTLRQHDGRLICQRHKAGVY